MWWRQIQLRLALVYGIIALALIAISITGQMRLLHEVGKTFGGFFWAIDTDGQVVVVSTAPQQLPFDISAGSVTSVDHIVSVQLKDTHGKVPPSTGSDALTRAYEYVQKAYGPAQQDQPITYGIEHGTNSVMHITRPAVTFTWDMWLQSYGLTFIAGLIWLVAGFIVLMMAREWVGAVEGITLLPPAMLFLLYSHWGNVQSAYPADIVFQLLWIPSFALLGAAFIHLSLTYRPEVLNSQRRPSMALDVLPYVPLLGLLAYEWSSYLFKGNVPTQINLTLALGYAAFGGVLSFIIGMTSLVRASRWRADSSIAIIMRRRLVDLLTLWIGGVGLGFCVGILPILLTGRTLLPLEIFFVLAAVYPILLLYAMRSLRMIDRLQLSLQQREQALHEREEALREQRQTAEELRQSNRELEQATSLLLHADAHLRSILSQRIHDQPKQQALRIRSLLGYWQHKLKVEAERDPEGKVYVPPVVEALGKVHKISEELESDLRGLQLLVEDAYQRRSLGLKLHLEKLIREDLPALHPESPLKIQADLWALDALGYNLEKTEEGAKIAEAISYTVTQALLNVYNHAGASYATVRIVRNNGFLDIYINDDGRGFDPNALTPDKTSLFKARLKAREAGGVLAITSFPRPGAQHGTLVQLRIPIPPVQEHSPRTGPLSETRVQSPGV